MTTQPTSTVSDPTATSVSRRRRPGRTVLLVVGIVVAAVAALGALALMALGALSLLVLTVLGRLSESGAPEGPVAQAPSASVAIETPPATHDDAGAIAVTQHWATVVGQAFRAGNPEPVRATSTADCSACQAVVAAVADPLGLPARSRRRPGTSSTRPS